MMFSLSHECLESFQTRVGEPIHYCAMLGVDRINSKLHFMVKNTTMNDVHVFFNLTRKSNTFFYFITQIQHKFG